MPHFEGFSWHEEEKEIIKSPISVLGSLLSLDVTEQKSLNDFEIDFTAIVRKESVK
jgi:hypothetical protein